MSEQKHHHHHRHYDDSEEIKRHNLNAIKYRKLAAKWGFRLLLLIAVIMAIAVVVVYNIR